MSTEPLVLTEEETAAILQMRKEKKLKADATRYKGIVNMIYVEFVQWNAEHGYGLTASVFVDDFDVYRFLSDEDMAVEGFQIRVLLDDVQHMVQAKRVLDNKIAERYASYIHR